MRGDSNSDIKNNVSSNRLSTLSSLSTSNPTTNKTSKSNCRSSSLTSTSITLKSNRNQLNKLIDLDASESESTDYVTGDSNSKSISDKNDLEILIENASTSDDASSKSSNRTFSIDNSSINTSSSRTSSHSTRTLTKNISKSLSESISDRSFSSQQSSTKQLINTSTSLYTTADDCSCDCRSDSSATLNENLNDAICCSRSSCLVSNCTCCLTHPNYLNKFKVNDKLVEQDETECLDNSSLDSSEGYNESTTTSFRISSHSKSLNQVNSDDQSTYNQEHTYTMTEDNDDDLQKDNNKLIKINELIELTNKSDDSNNHSKKFNQINQIKKIETNLIDFKNSHYDNQHSCATISESNNYEQLISNSPQASNEQDNSTIDQISDTNSSPLNDEETSSLSQLTKSIRTSNASKLAKQASDTIKLSHNNSSKFHQLTEKQLIEMVDSNLKSSLMQFQIQKLNTDSAKLITMNLDEDDLTDEDEEEDDVDIEKIKPNQLHLNTLSDISLLTFPEVEENVDTYKQHNSSRCLLNCSPNKCSSKNHNDLIDDTSTLNDLNLLNDLSDFNNSINTQSTAQIDDDQLMKYNDPTLNPGDHSSELDSDLDVEFDQEDEELVCLDEGHDQDIELLISNNLSTDICDNLENCDNNNKEEKNDLENSDSEMKDENKVEPIQQRLIALNKLSTDDFVIINNTNFDKFVSSKYSI